MKPHSWKPSESYAVALDETGFIFTTKEDKAVLRQRSYSPQELFDYFKMNLPSGMEEDGCSTRAIWISQTCEGLGLNVKHAVVKKTGLNGDLEVIQIKPPMPDYEWRYHIVPVLIQPSGEMYVLDLCLSNPVTFSEWQQCFEPGSGFTMGGDELAKQFGDLDFEYPQQLTLRMQHLWCKQVCVD